MQVGKALETVGSSQQYVSFGSMSAACMTQVDPCVPTGGSFSIWVYMMDCPDDEKGVITSRDKPLGGTGFYIRFIPNYFEYETAESETWHYSWLLMCLVSKHNDIFLFATGHSYQVAQTDGQLTLDIQTTVTHGNTCQWYLMVPE